MKPITKEQIASLEIGRYAGPVHLVSTPDDVNRALEELRHERLVGLDTETKPAFQRGQFHLPSLVQVAAERAVYLFQLSRPESFAAIVETLENPGLIKAGIGLTEDFNKLRKVFSFEPRNVVDLSAVARQHGIKQSGVRNLAAQMLGFRVTKGLCTSNWASPRLSHKQIIYAATDAWVCRRLFICFQERGLLDADGRPLRPPDRTTDRRGH